MANRRNQSQTSQGEVASSGWQIEGTGEIPSLTFIVEQTSILHSESYKSSLPGEPRWDKDSNPQPKYSYLVEVTYSGWTELFEAAKVTASGLVGQMCRTGAFTSNAHLDGAGKVKLNEGSEPLSVTLPLPKPERARKGFVEMADSATDAEVRETIEKWRAKGLLV